MRRYICFWVFAIAICAGAVAGKKAVRTVRVACIGNSITFGYGLEDPKRDSYPTQLEEMLNGGSKGFQEVSDGSKGFQEVSEGSKGFQEVPDGVKYEVGNFGHSSTTLARYGYLPYFGVKEFREMMDFHADIAIIHLGINDTDPKVWPCHRDEFVKDYLDLIDSVKVSNPKCRVILALMSPISDRHKRFDSGTRQWFFEIQDHIRLVAKLSGCQLIDFYTPLHNRPDLFPDRLHPAKEGYGIIARTVYEGITGDFGGLQLSPYWGDGMVLPRDRKFRMEGMANAGDVVSVFGLRDTVGLDGKWSVEIGPLESGKEYTIDVVAKPGGKRFQEVLRGSKRFQEVSGGFKRFQEVSKGSRRFQKEQHISFKAVAGELWLASGQSNMAFQLKLDKGFQKVSEGFREFQKVSGSSRGLLDGNDIRLLNLRPWWETDDREWSESALDSVNHLLYYKPAVWQRANAETVADFSAVAYYFAKTLQDSLQCPVGIICDAIGGSGIESWIDRGTLEKEFPQILRNWTQNDFLQEWVRGRALKNMGLKKAPNEFEEGFLQRHPYQPCYLYEASIDRLKTMPIDGVIWYQGESNAHNWTTHEKLFGLLQKSWRRAFGGSKGFQEVSGGSKGFQEVSEGSKGFQEVSKGSRLPFVYAQLSSLNRGQWTWFRDSQRRLQYKYLGTYMVVTSDKGDSLDVHPRDKQPVGYRMALRALRNVYGHKVEDSGPCVAKCFAGSKGFQEVSGGYSLEAHQASQSKGFQEVVLEMRHAEGLRTSDGMAARTFEVAETEGLFYPARAEIKGERIVLTCEEVKKPRYVRYGWQPYTRANVVNSAGLPMSTFRVKVSAKKSRKKTI